ncbi:MAG: CHAP domain-containing protein [Eubacteriales bacterium]|nr:CHAP domain-containing protein [Eubacteriales bacterium]
MKRILRDSVIAVVFVIIAITAFPATVFANDYEPRLTAPSGEPYYTRELNAYSQTGYGMPNCVAYAYGRIYELTGKAPKISKGDAGSWWFINKYNDYYEYGSEPRLGAVACWSNHVAVVEKINDDGGITISESHWGGNYFNTKTYYNMYSHYGQAFYGYIYMYTPPVEKEEPAPSYKMEETYFAPQEKTCFTALEFAVSDNQIMNPNNNFILNK